LRLAIYVKKWIGLEIKGLPGHGWRAVASLRLGPGFRRHLADQSLRATILGKKKPPDFLEAFLGY
jgi:hypothetical protein